MAVDPSPQISLSRTKPMMLSHLFSCFPQLAVACTSRLKETHFTLRQAQAPMRES